jgi:hypothetical protein
MYSDRVPFPVYCMSCAESDDWDATEYGRDYDFGKSFFEQYAQLRNDVPKKALVGIESTWTNSDYNNMAHELKNCYLLFNSDYNENTMYGSEVESTKDSIDVLMIDSSELCYSSVGIDSSQKVFFSMDCNNCSNVWFSREMVNCTDCFGCCGLRNKQYNIFNKQYSKEEYKKKIAEFNTGSYSEIQKLEEEFEKLRINYPYRYMRGLKNKGATGNYVFNSKNVQNSFFVTGAEDSKYCMWLIIKPTKDTYDFTQFGENVEKSYECLTCGLNCSDTKFSYYCVDNVSRLTYCAECRMGSSDLFGCDGLKRRQYCILNKQYTKEEYNDLVKKIIAHMNDMPYVDKKGRIYKYGEFFPYEHSLFGYNETDAQEFFPLLESEIKESGFRWTEAEKKEHEHSISWKDLPDDIKDVDENITKEVILCEQWDLDEKKAIKHNCTKAFKITARELEFYKKFNVPLPRRCHNSRHFFRFSKRNPVRLWERKCHCAGSRSDNEKYTNLASTHQSHDSSQHCPNIFQTSFSEDRPEIVYCESCYNAEVV